MTSDLSNSFMRTVSFVERIEVEFHGNIITQAMVLADVDNDMGNELVVGNIDGHVAIFKGVSPQPWRRMTVSGMLTCLAVGEVHVPKKNSLVCMTAEGWCYIYDVSSHMSTQSMGAAEDDNDYGQIKPFFTQELPANARVMCLADIDSDGHVEMVIGYSDRVVRAFRWHEIPDSDSGHFMLMQRWQLAGQIGSITINYNQDHQPELMVSQPGATFISLQVRPAFRHIKSDSYLDRMSENKPECILERSGSFVTSGRHDTSTASYMQNLPGHANLSKSEVSNKSDTISFHSDISNRSAENVSIKSIDSRNDNKSLKPEVNKSTDGHSSKSDTISRGGKSDSSPEKMDETHGKPTRKLSLEKLDSAHVAKLMGSPKDLLENALDRSQGRMNSVDSYDIIYHPLAHMQTRNKDTSTLIIGGINRGRPSYCQNSDTDSQPQPTYYALSTLDGSLILVENDTILWSLQVDHYLFALAKLDVTGNGKEEVVCCSWNGQTYIVNHSKEIVRYHFPDSVAAFCAGYFSLRDRNNTPCFVYATFNNRIYIYPNITLPQVESTNLINVMGKRNETKELLQKLNINADGVESLQSLYRWCLYGWPRVS
uniref:Integrin-alpha FG-GAP repeat-containing protein 2 n=2 Tax=Arion vulgaris TaxID=1028688 RepID=A0A0B6ZR61_9EUPU